MELRFGQHYFCARQWEGVGLRHHLRLLRMSDLFEIGRLRGLYLNAPEAAEDGVSLPESRYHGHSPAERNNAPRDATKKFQMVLCEVLLCTYFTVSSVIDHFVSIVMACALRGSLLVDSESDPSSSDCS